MLSGTFELSCARSSRNGKNRCVMPPDASTTTRRSVSATALPSSSPKSRKSSVCPHWLIETLAQRSPLPRWLQMLIVP